MKDQSSYETEQGGLNSSNNENDGKQETESKSSAMGNKITSISHSDVSGSEGVKTSLEFNGVTNVDDTLELLNYRTGGSDESSSPSKIALQILSLSRNGLTKLLSSKGVDDDLFNEGVRSRFYTIFTMLSRSSIYNDYSRWLFGRFRHGTSVPYLDKAKGQGHDSDQSWEELWRTLVNFEEKSNGPGREGLASKVASYSDGIRSMVLMLAGQFAYRRSDSNARPGIDMEEFSALTEDDDLSSSIDELANMIAKFQAFVTKNRNDYANVLFQSQSMSSKDLLETIASVDKEFSSHLSDTLDQAKSIFVSIDRKFGNSESTKSTSVVETTSFFFVKGQLSQTVRNVSLGKKVKDNEEKDVFSRAEDELKKLESRNIVGLIKSLSAFAYSYRAVQHSLDSIEDRVPSKRNLTSMVEHYVSVMSGAKDTRTEGEVPDLVNNMISTPEWTSSLAGLLYNLSSVPVTDRKIMHDEDYTNLLSMLNNILQSNRFFSMNSGSESVTGQDLSEVALEVGQTFSINQRTVSLRDVFGFKDSEDITVERVVDSLDYVLSDPTSSSLFSDVYKLLTMRTVLSDKVRYRVASLSSPLIMEPYSIPKDTTDQLKPALNSVSYALMAELGVYELSRTLTSLIALTIVRRQFSDLMEILDQKSMSLTKEILQKEETMDKLKELIGSLDEGVNRINNTISEVDPSILNIIDGIDTRESIFIDKGLSDNNSLADHIERTVTRGKLRMLKGVVSNAVLRNVTRVNPENTVQTTTDIDHLSDTLLKKCMEVLAEDKNPGGLKKVIDTNLDEKMQKIAVDVAADTRYQAQRTAIGKMLTVDVDLGRVLSSRGNYSMLSNESGSDPITFSLSKIVNLLGYERYVLPGGSTTLYKKAYSRMRPSFYRLTCVFDYSWRHSITSYHELEYVRVPFYDHVHLVRNVLERLGLSPEDKIKKSEASLLSDIIGSASLFRLDLAKFEGLDESDSFELISVISIKDEVIKGLRKHDSVDIAILSPEAIAELFNDKIVIKKNSPDRSLMIGDSIKKDIVSGNDRDDLSVDIVISAIEEDPRSRDFVTSDSLVKRIFNKVLVPIVRKFWM